MKVYKAVAGPKGFSVNKGNAQVAFDSFADLINKECAGGWTYHSMETLSVTEKSGCAMNRTEETTYYYMLIFEREG